MYRLSLTHAVRLCLVSFGTMSDVSLHEPENLPAARGAYFRISRRTTRGDNPNGAQSRGTTGDEATPASFVCLENHNISRRTDAPRLHPYLLNQINGGREQDDNLWVATIATREAGASRQALPRRVVAATRETVHHKLVSRSSRM